ncbi:MAG: metal-dependent hydrolase [Haloarculaceae archaeon]
MVASSPAFGTAAHELLVGLDVVLHALVGYLLVQYLTPWPPTWGALGGLVPNLDLPLGLWFQPPLVHRGLVHTPLFMLVVAGALLAGGVQRRRVAAFAVGYLAELGFDTVEGTDGIMWTYPLSSHHYASPLPVSDAYWIPPLFVVALALVVYQRTRVESTTA